MSNVPPQLGMLAHFLRRKRERLSPSDVGLPDGGRRRTPGLRREEVASLASVSLTWYTALEQGKDVRPSESVLNSLANVLSLTESERQHLFWLARLYPIATAPTQEDDDAHLSPSLLQMLRALEPNPAYILNLSWDYVAWNQAADVIFTITNGEGKYDRNLLWRLFTDPSQRNFYNDWEQVAQNAVAEFRAEIEKYLCHRRLCHMLIELQENNCSFEALWQQHHVQFPSIRQRTIYHPDFGQIRFERTPLQLAEYPTFKVIVYTADTESMERLQYQ